jgi:hypothetical protein
MLRLHPWRHATRSVRGLFRQRPLLPPERHFLAQEFGDSLDLDALRLAGGGHPFGRVGWQPGAALIQLDDGCFEAGSPSQPVSVRVYPILAHEALHVWQRVHRHCRVNVSVDGLWLGVLQGRSAYAYDTAIEHPDALLRAFLAGNIERQGQIFEDYVRSNVHDPYARDGRFAHVARYVREMTRG